MQKYFFWLTLACVIGMMLFPAGKPVNAQDAELDCPISGEPGAYDSYLSQGDYARDQGDYAAAVNHYSCAIQVAPEDPTAYRHRAKIYLDHLVEYEKAIADYSALLNLIPDDALAYNNRGWAYYQLEDYNQAIDNFTRALDFNPDLALAYNNRGVARNSQYNFSGAIADFNRAIELDLTPLHWAYINLGIAYAARGQMDSAIESLETAVQLAPYSAEVYRWLGDYYFAAERFDDALKAYKRHVELAGDVASPQVLEQIARLDVAAEFTKSIPMLLIVALVSIVLLGVGLPFIRRRQFKTMSAPKADLIPTTIPPTPLPDETTETAPTEAKPIPVSGKRPTLVLLPLATAAVSAIVFVLLRIRRSERPPRQLD